MGRCTKARDNLTVRYVEPTYASEEERQAAIARANDALRRLAQLLGRKAARDAIRSAAKDESPAKTGT
jgi:hypothetical protein